MTDVAFYERLRDKTATPLLSRFGAPSLYRRVENVYDPETGTTVPTNFDSEVSAARTELDLSMVDGDTVLASDSMLIISAGELATVPKPGDYVFHGSTVESAVRRYRVVKNMPVDPGAVNVIYQVVARR